MCMMVRYSRIPADVEITKPDFNSHFFHDATELHQKAHLFTVHYFPYL